MHIKLFLCFLAATAIAGPIAAQDFKPFPRANITASQWASYFEEVRSKHGSNVQDFEDQKLLVYTDQATTTLYAFTKPGHPAHPAWITRKPEQRSDSVFIAQIGYFAGEEPPFAQLFRTYLALNERMKEDIKRKQLESAKGQAASEPSR